MNIWLLHPFAGGPGLGRHWRPFWLADAWMKMGHRPLVVSAAFHHLHRKPQVPGFQQINNVDFWFVDTPRYGRGSVSRLRNNLSFGQSLRRDALDIAEQFGKPELIIASSPHLFFIPAAHRLARRFDAKFWVEVRDLWPESIVALGLVPAWHPLVKLLAFYERSAYRAADRLICLLAGAESHMRSRGLAPGKFVWIPNGVSEREIQNAIEKEKPSHPLIDQIREMKRRGKQIVVYAGAMGPPNAMGVIIEAAGKLSVTQPEIQFVLIGSGGLRAELEQCAAKLPNIQFHDEIDRPIVHGILHESDCAVVSFHKNALYRHGISPNKLFDYCLFAPRSVTACEQKALEGLEKLVTLRCEPDGSALAQAMRSALQLPGRTLRERVEIAKKYSYAELAARYLA